MTSAIYTSIVGNKDSLLTQNKFEGFSNYLFSDEKYENDSYNVIVNPREFENPRMEAKKYKLFPAKYLPSEFDISIWVDGNVRVIKNPSSLIADYIVDQNYDILTFNHPRKKRTIYQEIETCIKQNGRRGNVSNLNRQYEAYKELGIPDYSVTMCRVIIRRHSIVCNDLMNSWWSEIQNYSIRDQVSFPYVITQSECKWKSLSYSQFGVFFKKTKHRS